MANVIAELDDDVARKAGKLDNPEPTYTEDRYYTDRIIKELDKNRIVRLYHNPWTKHEAENTPEYSKRNAILKELQNRYFTDYHSTTFPILMSNEYPATFLAIEQKGIVNDILGNLAKKYRKDQKMLTDALCNPKIKFQFLLTRDRDHLATKVLRDRLKEKRLELIVCTPKQLFKEVTK